MITSVELHLYHCKFICWGRGKNPTIVK